MISILQANLHRSKTADNLLHQLALEYNVDLLILSEQYRNRDFPIWYNDTTETAAIWIREPRKFQIKNHGNRPGFVWITSQNETFFSCYFTPNESIHDFRIKIDALEDEVRKTAGNVIIAGDFNARAVEWGMDYPDSRGKYIIEMVSRLGLLVLNTGSTTTFRRPGQKETIPDVSFGSENISARITTWKVIEDYTGSDHQYIFFQIGDRLQNIKIEQPKPRRWNPDKLNVLQFCRVLAQGINKNEQQSVNRKAKAERLVNSTMRLITKACDASMPRNKQRHSKPPIYWWTSEIAELRKLCLRARRAAQRAKHHEDVVTKSAEYKAFKKLLRKTINQSKTSCWKRLTEDINRDPWGQGYKIVQQKLGNMRPHSVLNESTMTSIVKTLFPTHPLRPEVDFGEIPECPPFSDDELKIAIKSSKNKKAPGPDGIPSEALKIVAQENPHLLLEMYNTCLRAGVFPSPWKTARLVLISKDKGDSQVPSSYRPLCMLDTAGKILEKLLKMRLISAIADAGDLSPRQYGFRTGRSTIDAIQEVIDAVKNAENHNHHSRRIVLLVTLDVKNAFNCAKWSDILHALEHNFQVPKYLLRILDDYLKDRVLVYDTLEGEKRIPITSGAAQGSILGPDLWNVAYDSLLRLSMPEETILVGYADDVAVLIAARNMKLAQIKLNQVMRKINKWMHEHGLSLALNKTEIVVLTKKRIDTSVTMVVGEEMVMTKRVARYLGIMIDSKLSFLHQINHTAEKAAKGVASLSRLMANIGGPSSSKRRLLMTAVQSVLLYGAEIWADALSKEIYSKRLAQVQRRVALRVASAYRTVSHPAVLVIAGVIPIDILAQERSAIYRRKLETDKDKVKIEERTRTMEDWQATWEQDSRGRWTARLIGQIQAWVERKHGEIDYYMTQFLSGHGYFNSYLFKMGKVTSPDCKYCPGASDNAYHTFFQCDHWAQERGNLEAEINVLSPETIIEIVLREEKYWILLSRYIQTLLRKKKIDIDNGLT